MMYLHTRTGFFRWTLGGLLIVAIALCVTYPYALFAHNSGASLEKSVPPYIVDIGYDPVSPVAGDRLLFDFTLVDTASTSIPFDYVWVRIEKDSRTILATGIAKAAYGPTSLLYAIPEDLSGELQLFVRYQRDDESLAEADFLLNIAPKEAPLTDYIPVVGSLVLGSMLGFGATWASMRRRSKNI